jgi:hypothetical protein
MGNVSLSSAVRLHYDQWASHNRTKLMTAPYSQFLSSTHRPIFSKHQLVFWQSSLVAKYLFLDCRIVDNLNLVVKSQK